MADSPAEAILDAIVTQLQGNDIDLTGVSGTPDVPDDQIIATAIPWNRDSRQQFAAAIARPAIVVSVPNVTVDPAAGDNCRYIAMHTVTIQILHTELDFHYSAITKSVLKWEYQIRNYLHMSNLKQAADDGSNAWMVTLTPFGKVDLRHEKALAIFDDALSVSVMQAKVNESHNSAGRT